MAKRKIRFNPFDPRSIEAAVQEVNKLHDKILKCSTETLNELARLGAEIAGNTVFEMDAIDTGELLASIYFVNASPEERVSKVVADSPHAGYVEYGTGIVGAGLAKGGSEHPNADADGWAYDVNNHGADGWWYFDKVRGRRRWTMGMPARPFMYSTRFELERQAPKITGKIFRSL